LTPTMIGATWSEICPTVVPRAMVCSFSDRVLGMPRPGMGSGMPAIGATIRKAVALQWALTKGLGEQEQIAVRVLDQEFMPTTLTITIAPPNYARLLIKRRSL